MLSIIYPFKEVCVQVFVKWQHFSVGRNWPWIASACLCLYVHSTKANDSLIKVIKVISLWDLRHWAPADKTQGHSESWDDWVWTYIVERQTMDRHRGRLDESHPRGITSSLFLTSLYFWSSFTAFLFSTISPKSQVGNQNISESSLHLTPSFLLVDSFSAHTNIDWILVLLFHGSTHMSIVFHCPCNAALESREVDVSWNQYRVIKDMFVVFCRQLLTTTSSSFSSNPTPPKPLTSGILMETLPVLTMTKSSNDTL